MIANAVICFVVLLFASVPAIGTVRVMRRFTTPQVLTAPAIRVVCGWCGRYQGSRPGGVGESTTICGSCQRTVFDRRSHVQSR